MHNTVGITFDTSPGVRDTCSENFFVDPDHGIFRGVFRKTRQPKSLRKKRSTSSNDGNVAARGYRPRVSASARSRRQHVCLFPNGRYPSSQWGVRPLEQEVREHRRHRHAVRVHGSHHSVALGIQLSSTDRCEGRRILGSSGGCGLAVHSARRPAYPRRCAACPRRCTGTASRSTPYAPETPVCDGSGSPALRDAARVTAQPFGPAVRPAAPVCPPRPRHVFRQRAVARARGVTE